MAKMTISSLNLILVLCLVLMISIAESRELAIGFGKGKSSLSCKSVYGAEEGDTCGSVIDKFQLSFDLFLSINPNINCDSFFVGQWLCTDGHIQLISYK